MINKKEIKLDLLARKAYSTTLTQHGLINEAELEQTSLYGDLPISSFKSLKVGKADTEEAKDIDYVLDTFVSNRSIDNLNQIIKGVNSALGVREMEFVGAAEAREDEEQKTNVRQIASAVYLIKLFNLILAQQRPQAAGYIFESLVARMIGGTLPAGTSTPIQDVLDSKGTLVSVKALSGKAEAIKGSKLGLAQGIIRAEESSKKQGSSSLPGVVYLIAVKSESASPFKVSFYKFVVTRENFFQFITRSSDAVDDSGNLSPDALGFFEKLKNKVQKAKERSEKKKKKKDTSGEPEPTGAEDFQDDDESLNEGVTGPRSLNTIYFELTNGNLDELNAIKKEKIKQIMELPVSQNDLESFGIVFRSFLETSDGSKKIKFPTTNKPVVLDNEKQFKESLVDLLFPKGDESTKIIKQTVFDNFFVPKFFDLSYDGNAKSHNVETYDFLPEGRQIENKSHELKFNFSKFKSELDSRNTQFSEKLKDIVSKEKQLQGKGYENLSFYEFFVKQNLYNEIAKKANMKEWVNVKNHLDLEYEYRDREIYRKEFKEVIETYKRAFGPIMAWFKKLRDDLKKQEDELAKKNREIVTTRTQSPQGQQKIANFFDFIKKETMASGVIQESLEEGLLIEEKAGPDPEYSQFLNKFSDMFSLGIDIDDDFEELIISAAETKQISNKNKQILKEFLEQYFSYFEALRRSSQEYFIKDNEKGIVEVSKTLEEFKKHVDNTYFESGKEKKASELEPKKEIKEVLNSMTEEAIIVMEMLKRMEG